MCTFTGTFTFTRGSRALPWMAVDLERVVVVIDRPERPAMKKLFLSLFAIAIFLVIQSQTCMSSFLNVDEFNTIEQTEEELLLAEIETALLEVEVVHDGGDSGTSSSVRAGGVEVSTPVNQQLYEGIDTASIGEDDGASPDPVAEGAIVATQEKAIEAVAIENELVGVADEQILPLDEIAEGVSISTVTDNVLEGHLPSSPKPLVDIEAFYSMQKKHAELQALYDEAIRNISALQLKEKLLRNDVNVLQLKHDSCILSTEAMKMDSSEIIEKCQKDLQKVKGDFSSYLDEETVSGTANKKNTPKASFSRATTSSDAPPRDHHDKSKGMDENITFFESMKSQLNGEHIATLSAQAIHLMQQCFAISIRAYEILYSGCNTVIMPYVTKALEVFCKVVAVSLERYIIPSMRSFAKDYAQPFYIHYINDYVVIAISTAKGYYDTYASKYVNRYHAEILAVMKEHHIDSMLAINVAPYLSYVRENMIAAAYFVSNYYNSDDVHIRLLKLLTDAHSRASQYQNTATDIIARLITVSELVDEKYASILARIFIYSTTGIFIFKMRKIIFGVSAFVLMIILSPLLLVIFILSKVLGACFGRRRKGRTVKAKKYSKVFNNINPSQQQQQQLSTAPSDAHPSFVPKAAAPSRGPPAIYNNEGMYNTNYQIPPTAPQTNQAHMNSEPTAQPFVSSYTYGGSISRASTETPRAGTGYNSI